MKQISTELMLRECLPNNECQSKMENSLDNILNVCRIFKPYSMESSTRGNAI